MPQHDPTIRHHVLGLGNAIVDVFSETTDRDLERLGFAKGTMTLVDEPSMQELHATVASTRYVSGGSCANTMAALASLGADAHYIGKVQRDDLGAIFGRDIRTTGVTFDTAPLDGGPATARCIVLVTPDAQRTMVTYLGACVELGPDDVDEAAVRGAMITYLEGYLWDRPDAKAACIKAAEVAHGAGRKIALTLSDPFCVDRWRDEFVPLIERHVDIVIANEAEITSLFQANDVDAAVREIQVLCEFAALTRSADGSVVVSPEGRVDVPAAPVGTVVDTTGAGDLYAAGLLHGLTHGFAPAEAGRLGSLTAATILSQMGARPERSLAPLVQEVRPAA